jgi:hypothetical protein
MVLGHRMVTGVFDMTLVSLTWLLRDRRGKVGSMLSWDRRKD